MKREEMVNGTRKKVEVEGADKWAKEEEGWFKINSVASADPKSGKNVIGMVIRNSQGELMEVGGKEVKVADDCRKN
ncbi:hypothetical protein DITRI_Ditri17bG0021600 [Diplodiscus trichospermus]